MINLKMLEDLKLNLVNILLKHHHHYLKNNFAEKGDQLKQNEMKYLLFIVLLTITSCGSRRLRCPIKENTFPCGCTYIPSHRDSPEYDSYEQTTWEYDSEDQDSWDYDSDYQNSSVSDTDAQNPSISDTDNRKPWVYCERITSGAQLKSIGKVMENFTLTGFILANSSIGILPSNVFQGVKTRFVGIVSTDLTSLSEGLDRPPFVGLEDYLEGLEMLDSFTNEDYPLTKLPFSHLKKLLGVIINGTKIPIIGDDFFEGGSYSISVLELINTSTQELADHAFHALTNLTKLDLTGGSFSVVKRSMFPMPALNLEILNLRDNQIHTLPQDIFLEMPSLKTIDLGQNDLKILDEVVFSTVWSQLSYALLGGNPFNCTDEMKWIVHDPDPSDPFPRFHGHCARPRKLKGLWLYDLTLSDFQ